MPDTLHAAAVEPRDLEQIASFAEQLPQGSPVSVVLQHLVMSLSQGKDVTYATTQENLTPQQAAELLKMSRPHLMKLIRAGALEAEMVGTHHRIPMTEILAFIDRRERAKAEVAVAYSTTDAVRKAASDAVAQLTDEDIAALNAL